mgnify:CR=1 FL=1
MISSIPFSDRELLSAFVKSADGTAFAALTERHLGLVFGVACRRTGSREMAQEAAQNTFCRLARHAPKLNVGTSLGPWLHAVALREAGTLLRAEAARQRAMQRLAVSAGPPETGGFSAPPPPGSEHLDEALAALPEAARRVLVLRYLQGMSLREVALKEDTSEEAARKRVTRALEHLTRLLARRGVTSASVTACLATASLLWPAPTSAATLAARALKQAAAPAAGAGLSGMAGFALSQWPVAAAFLLTAVPVAWPWGEVPGSKSASASTLQSPATGNAEQTSRTATKKEPAKATGLAEALMQEVGGFASKGWIMRDLRANAGYRTYRVHFNEYKADALRLAAANRAVLDFSLEEVREAVRLCANANKKLMIEESLYARLAELSPEEARQSALAGKSPGAMWGVLQAQAVTDQLGAARWAKANAPDLIDPLMEPLAASDPAGYLRLMDSLRALDGDPSDQLQYGAIFPNSPRMALEGWWESEKQGNLGADYRGIRDAFSLDEIDPTQVETLVSFAAGLPENSALREECQSVAALMLAREQPERAADLLVAGGFIHQTEATWRAAIEPLLKDWKRRDAGASAQWLSERSGLDPDEQSRLAKKAGITLPDP